MRDQGSGSTGQTEWETLDVGCYPLTKRLKVPGGWIVMVMAGSGVGTTFYPDEQHQWEAPIKEPRSGWFGRK